MTDETTHSVIAIVGTNASGKSGLAISLAKQFNGEVISADSRQVYTGLDIATGKVTKTEMAGVPHHLIDVVNPKKAYTAADFARDGQKALQDILKRGNVPIIAGGTGFYVDALLNPSLLASVPPNKTLRAELEKESAKELFAQLKELDPKRAADLAAKGEDTLKRRLIRAIEVASAPPTKKVVSDAPKLNVLWIGLSWHTDLLKERIHTRTLQRMKRGMVAEAKKLHEKGLSWKRMQELGLEYKHLADFLRDRITKDELIANIDRDDWRYAKRQRTWFRKYTRIHWFEDGDTKGVDELVEGFLRS